MDSHGGFHGDGKSYVEISFAHDQNNTLTEEIEQSEHWSKFPLSDILHTAVYGKKSPSEIIGPAVSIKAGESLFPNVTNGYYFFYDRHSESKDGNDETNLLNRSSVNFTIAIYDVDTKTLYYYELDT